MLRRIGQTHGTEESSLGCDARGLQYRIPCESTTLERCLTRHRRLPSNHALFRLIRRRLAKKRVDFLPSIKVKVILAILSQVCLRVVLRASYGVV